MRARLASLFGGTGPERPTSDVAGPVVQVDACWTLLDGSICIEGWSRLSPSDELLEVRVEGDEEVGWSPLMRKNRPDVADAFGTDAAAGFIGHVPSVVTARSAVSLEFRQGDALGSFTVLESSDEAVPEDAFIGLVTEGRVMSPAILAPVVDVIRLVPVPTAPVARPAYRMRSSIQPWLTTVVPVYGNFEYLRNLLMAMTVEPDDGLETIIVCDDPTLELSLLEWVRAWNDSVFRLPITVLVHDRNAGFAAACNSGLAAAGGEFVLLLNSDVLVARPRGDLRRLASRLGDGVAAVAPVLLFPDGTLQHAGMVHGASAEFPGFNLPTHPGKGEAPSQLPGEPFAVPLLTGAAIVTTVELLRSVGGVPPVFGRGDFEDVLLSVALGRAGRLVVDPDVRWTHVESGSYRREDHGGVPLTLSKSLVIDERLAEQR